MYNVVYVIYVMLFRSLPKLENFPREDGWGHRGRCIESRVAVRCLIVGFVVFTRDSKTPVKCPVPVIRLTKRDTDFRGNSSESTTARW